MKTVARPISAPPQPRRRECRPATHRAIEPFRALIVYGEVAAARLAMTTVKKMLRRSRRDAPLQPMLWRFDQLGHRRWREMAIDDAARAELLVVATADPTTLPVTFEEWLAAVVQRNRCRSTRLLALLGEDDAWTISLQHTPNPSRSARAPAGTPLVVRREFETAAELSLN